MRQCILTKVEPCKETSMLKKTGNSIITMLDKVQPGMEGSIVELKRVKGFWVLDSIEKDESTFNKVKCQFSVGEIK